MAARRTPKTTGCAPGLGSCCKVESIVTVDDRGQMVLPKDVRARAGIAPGDKLALGTWDAGGEVCCLFLIKADRLTTLVNDLLGPVMKQLAGK